MVTVKLCDAVAKEGFNIASVPLKEKYESLYINNPDKRVSSCMTHPLLDSVMLAYNWHLPLVLRPDDIWLTIAQGISQHINSFRHKLVSHNGKMKLNATGLCFEDSVTNMVDTILSKCKNNGFVRMMLNTFSTSTPATLLASQANLMGSVSKYFEYEVSLLCGIPYVTLEGTLEDWQEIAHRIKSIRDLKIGLEWWADDLTLIANQFVETYKGNVDMDFWGHILDANNIWGSGVSVYINGWISKLFPYNRHGKKNETESDMFPRGINKVEFMLDETQQELEIVSGFLGMQVCEGAVSPYIGWYIREKHFSHSQLLLKHAKIMEGKPKKCCAIA